MYTKTGDGVEVHIKQGAIVTDDGAVSLLGPGTMTITPVTKTIEEQAKEAMLEDAVDWGEMYRKCERPRDRFKRRLRSLWWYPEDGNCTQCMGCGYLGGDTLCSCVTEGCPPLPTFWQRLTRLFSDPRFLDRSPIITTFLLEWANVMQIWRMTHDHSALGQNAWSWLSVNVALWLWCNFYRAKFLTTALRMTLLGVIINTIVVLTVSYYRGDPVTALLGGLSLGVALRTLWRSK